MDTNIVKLQTPINPRREPLPISVMRPAKSDATADLSDEPVNILIVDDEPKNLTVLESILDDPGYRLVRAESADQALLALLEEEFALLILDIKMPAVSGFELAAMIKERKKSSRIPIIYLTAYYGEDQHVLEGYGTGAVDYLHKPVNPAILRSKVAVFAELYRKSREVGAANHALLAEIIERRKAVEQLGALNETLERRVTERTEALRLSEERLRAIFDGTFEFMGLLTSDGKLVEANQPSLDFARCLREDVIGQYFWETIWFQSTPGAPAIVRQAFERAAAGEVVRQEMSIASPVGKLMTFDVSYRPVRNGRGQVIHIVSAALDITERKETEAQIRLLLDEVNHRAKNNLSVVLAIAKQTLVNNSVDFVHLFSRRIQALSASQDLLVKTKWQGIDIIELVRAQLAHFEDLLDQRIILDGVPFTLSINAAQAIGMVMHELATNAAKHGALSTQNGRVEIAWRLEPRAVPERFTISWIERDGPPVVTPIRQGFGSTVIKNMIELSLDGEATLDYAPSGIVWRFACRSNKALDRANANHISRKDPT